jgi:hypothetical protein
MQEKKELKTIRNEAVHEAEECGKKELRAIRNEAVNNRYLIIYSDIVILI